MFVNDILNDDGYFKMNYELKLINNTYRNFIKEYTSFRELVCIGLEKLVNKRLLTGIPKTQYSSYYVGLNSCGFGLYYINNGCRGRLEIETYLPVLKSMCTDEIVTFLVQHISKQSKKTRFLNIVKAIQKYRYDEVEVGIDYGVPVIDPTDYELNMSNIEERRIFVKNLRIVNGEFRGIANNRFVDFTVNSISNFLIFEQVLDEITKLREEYVTKMEQWIIYNRLTRTKLENDLSGYFAAKSI